MKPSKGVQKSTYIGDVYYVHYVPHGAKVVAFFQDVLGELRLVSLLIVPVKFSEPHVERAICLSNIFFFVASRSCQLVYTILVKFVLLMAFLRLQEFY